MDKEVLMSTLNRLEDKLDKVSTGLATNTAETKSHTDMLSDMKGVHDLNAKVILDTRDEVKDLKNGMMRIESWKNGQTLYQQKMIDDVLSLQSRIQPIEADFAKRQKTGDKISDIVWRSVERLAMWAAVLMLGWVNFKVK